MNNNSPSRGKLVYSVHQPHYLPYAGYLAKVADSDVFVFLEQVQYVRREWQNRNKVKGPDGAQWLTVPVKGAYKDPIDKILLDDSKNWQASHLDTLKRFYAKSEYLSELDGFAEIINKNHSSLADLTTETTSFFVRKFGIKTPIQKQQEFNDLPETPNERILEIGKRLGADTYLAGAGGRNYMDVELFENAGIKVEFQEFKAHEYPQLHGEFVPYLATIDLLLNCGSAGFFKYVKNF